MRSPAPEDVYSPKDRNYGELCGYVGNYEELWGIMGLYGELWVWGIRGDYGEFWGMMGMGFCWELRGIMVTRWYQL